ncbi:type III restriction-modification system endonuclease [Selenomonas ruminantium]|uniref:Type III restriction enzyme n=1 Tax=Selenomonas ruminantium TaxID=971 RepID=A0A1H0UDM9_SELRU|nr:DEAD/DEAH box helicase family protein [Selenomonas ruminantium]SDP64337.1 type III restriction enzyme [Selenomonas ruminantium]
MKLKFDSTLDYQQEAIAAVRDVFQGQTPKQALFTVAAIANEQMALGFGDESRQMTLGQGIGNRLMLDEEDLLNNIRAVQLRHGLPQSNSLPNHKLNLDIEMETGTGKTYVYLRTLLELNKAYGFTKFIIVVPSVAIKEGVQKTIEITRDHFRGLYSNVNYDAFVYDGKHIEKIRDFATSNDIQIMVMTINSFQNDLNLINRYNDKKFGESKPIDLVRETKPIVVIDEPQSTISTDAQVEAVESLNPLCTIRYSATPIRVENKLYRLNAVDSFAKKLVKGIEVESFAAQDDHNEAYLLLKSVNNKKSPITARVEMDVQNKRGVVQRKAVTVKQGDDLYEKSGGRDVYEGYIVKDIYCAEGSEYMDFTSCSDILHLGKAIGTVHDDEMKRQQMRATIEEHLNKELELNPKGIKVLSLFFIDRVANYREYDAEGNAVKGKYAKWFEEIYQDMIRRPKYHDLWHRLHNEDDEAELVHDGYFSADKGKKNEPGHWKDTSGSTAADDSTYNLIMKDKERLLSFDCKIRFIFSHSALREGWDNPNVFQICTLNETKSTIKKRQEIGRGLRLCVNQTGERQYDANLNILTVMANESYDEFASSLQKEYEEDGIRFRVLETANFANILVPVPAEDVATGTAGEETAYLGTEKAEMVMESLKEYGYVDDEGNIQESLKADIQQNKFVVAEELAPYKAQIQEICMQACRTVPIHKKRERREAVLNKEVFLSPEFKELWDSIKWKTTYRVDFSTEELLRRCRKQMALEMKIPSPKIIQTKADLTIGTGGVETKVVADRAVSTYGSSNFLPDIVAYLQNETNLTRRTIVELLTGTRQDEKGTWIPFDDYGNRLKDFQKNPQVFMENTAKILRSVMKSLIVDGIKYQRLGDSEYYCQELFESEELKGYLESNMLESTKSPYNYVVYDSENERQFAQSFEDNEDVYLYAKLPDWFKISTPLGSYNPDWAVMIDQNGEKKLYFVLETKGNIDTDALRKTESEKIQCGREHFAALGDKAEFMPVDNFTEFMHSI